MSGEALYERYKDALKRGHVASLRGRVDEALAAYAEAARIAPERSMPHTSAGTALMRRKRPAEALRHYEVALRIGPRDEAAMLGRAQALAALDRRSEAADAFDHLAEYRALEGKLGDAVDAARRGLELAEGRERRRTLERLIDRLRSSEPDEPGRIALERALLVLEGPAVAARTRPRPVVPEGVVATGVGHAGGAAVVEETAAGEGHAADGEADGVVAVVLGDLRGVVEDPEAGQAAVDAGDAAKPEPGQAAVDAGDAAKPEPGQAAADGGDAAKPEPGQAAADGGDEAEPEPEPELQAEPEPEREPDPEPEPTPGPDPEPEPQPEPEALQPVLQRALDRPLPEDVDLEQLARQAELLLDSGNPSAPDRLLDLAAASLRAGRVNVALDACYQALSLDPDDVDLHLALVELYDDRGWSTLASEKLDLLGRLATLSDDTRTEERLAATRAIRG